MFFGTKISKNYAIDFQFFEKFRSISDGIDFFGFKLGIDWYKSDHNPKFNIFFCLFNFLIFDFMIYNVNHVEDSEDSGIYSERDVYLELVGEFHDTFEHPVLSKPQIPDEKRCELRVSLLQEELNELKQAISDKNIVSVADAFADIQYVLSGAILEFGLGDKFRELFEEVHNSNMSKVCYTKEEALDTISYYETSGTEAYYKEKDGKFLVYRKSDDKTLKSINYSKADLKSILT